MSSERRQFVRFPFHSRAEVQFRGMSCEGTLRDISLNGALFTFDEVPINGSFLRPCRLHIRYIGEEKSNAASFNGLVVHAHGEMLGIKFIAVSEKERMALIHLIDLNLAEPTLLDRDVPALLKFLASLKEDSATDTA